MTDWLEGLSALVVFYSIAIVASVVLVVQILLTVVGFDDADGIDVDADFGDGLSILSFRSLTGFFGGFGWTGVIMLENGASLPAATAAGVGAGMVLMLSIAYIMKVLYSLRESGTLDYNNAVGQVGTVYVAIPPRQSGAGQVRVMVQGRLTIVSAYTEGDHRIPAEAKVKVKALVDPRTLLVEPLGEPETKEPGDD